MSKSFKIVPTEKPAQLDIQHLKIVRSAILQTLHDHKADATLGINAMVNIIAYFIQTYYSKDQRKNVVEEIKYVIEDLIEQIEKIEEKK